MLKLKAYVCVCVIRILYSLSIDLELLLLHMVKIFMLITLENLEKFCGEIICYIGTATAK